MTDKTENDVCSDLPTDTPKESSSQRTLTGLSMILQITELSLNLLPKSDRQLFILSFVSY